MNIKAFSNAITSKVGRQVLVVQKNSPTLLFGAGVIGVIGAGVLACRATLKLEQVIEDTQRSKVKAEMLVSDDYSEQDRKRDLTIIYTRGVINIAKLYTPAVVVGAAGIGCLAGGQIILNRRNTALIAAYVAVEKGFKEYRNRVVEEFGEDKDREFRHGTETREFVEETDEGPVVTQVKHVKPGDPSMYARFFDEYNTNWTKQPEYNLVFLRCQQNYANDLLRSRGHVLLNDVYDLLGMDRSKAGAVVGWTIGKEGDNFIDFGIFDGNNPRARDFVNGREGSILLDFNVDGVVYDKI